MHPVDSPLFFILPASTNYFQAMNLFYDPQLNPEALHGVFHMNAEESWHCAKVLRMRAGDEIRITDGKGGNYTGKLITVDPKACAIEILSALSTAPRNYSIHLAVAPTKNMARFEWFLEKATEVGIDKITPLICARSEKISVRTERLNKIITTAMKQSLNVFHPHLMEPIPFPEFVKNCSATQQYIAWCETDDDPLLINAIKPSSDAIVLIGPEGDFTPDEVRLAENAGFLPISLGKNRLRTETAALAACFAIHFINSLNQ